MKDTKATPFFAKFLEGMEETEIERVKGGATCKFPSDSDEWILMEDEKEVSVNAAYVTHKYPSDNDEAVDM